MNFLKDKKIRNWGLAIIAIAAVVWLTINFTFANAGDEATVDEATVISINIAETIDASGSLEADPFASLKWKTAGTVAAIYVQTGDMVHAGDILLTLQPDSTSANIASAQADLVAAQKNLEDILNSDSGLAQVVINLKDAQEEYDDALEYLEDLQDNKKIPQTETQLQLVRTPRGYEYVYKTKSFKGPATQDMLIEAENDLEIKRATLEDLQREYVRLKNNKQDVLAAQSRVDAAQATINTMSIIAPFDGQVLSVEHHAGDVVAAGELSVNVADLDRLYVRAQVDESDVAKVKVGNQVKVTLDALPGIELSGSVESINPVGEVSSGLIKFSVLIALNPIDGEIIVPLGATADSVIEVREAAEVLAVPLVAVQNDDQGEYVLVMQSNGVAGRVAIESSTIEGDYVVVTGNLKTSDVLQIVHDNDIQAAGPLAGGNK